MTETVITRARTRARIANALSQQIGRHGIMTYEQAADATGIPARTLKAHVLGQAMPELHCWMSYVRLPRGAGGAICAATLDLAGFQGAHPKDPAACSPMRLLGIMTEESAVLARCLEDGVVDSNERAELAPRLRLLAARLQEQAEVLDPNSDTGEGQHERA